MHTYIHTYIITYIHTYIRACIHAYMHTYIHTYIITYIHTYIHTCMHTCIHTYIHNYIHTYIRACIHAYMHTYIHTYIITYIHTYIRACIHALMHVYAFMHVYLRRIMFQFVPGPRLAASKWTQRPGMPPALWTESIWWILLYNFIKSHWIQSLLQIDMSVVYRDLVVIRLGQTASCLFSAKVRTDQNGGTMQIPLSYLQCPIVYILDDFSLPMFCGSVTPLQANASQTCF